MNGPRVELFRTDDYVPSGERALFPLLRDAFEPVLRRSLLHCRFQLVFLPIDDSRAIRGIPTMTNLRPSYGYVEVRIVDEERIIYRHPHSMREIVGAPLRRILRKEDPEEKHWGFSVRAPMLEDVPLVRPAPLGDGQVDVTMRPERARRFSVEEIEMPDPPVATLAELGVVDGVVTPTDKVVVVLDHATQQRLVREMEFSDAVEEGGFLTGRVYRAQEKPDSYLVHVTGAVPAERTGASFLQFTFTGESFLRMGDRLASVGNDDQLVGWYHTHLFAATDQIGLSSIDVELHTSTFRAPWQVAGLVNIESGRRVLRFYRTDDQTMVGAPFWVVDP